MEQLRNLFIRGAMDDKPSNLIIPLGENQGDIILREMIMNINPVRYNAFRHLCNGVVMLRVFLFKEMFQQTAVKRRAICKGCDKSKTQTFTSQTGLPSASATALMFSSGVASICTLPTQAGPAAILSI